MSGDRCPDSDILEQFLLGFCDDILAEELETHLVTCESCANKANLVLTDDDLVTTMRKRSPILAAANEAFLDSLVSRTLKGITSLPLPTKVDCIPGFSIERMLGQGGMGVVYLARDERIKRLVAVKLLTSFATSQPSRIVRFRREAEMLARIRHPNVVQLYDMGEATSNELETAVPYLILEYIEGGSLNDLLQQGPLEIKAAAGLTEAIAEGVQAAHEQGVIHRDLKPGNILLDSTDHPKVSDFGLARIENEDGQTDTGAILGTPAYMAPEQAAGHDVGPTGDVYSMGVILYEMLTGRVPFRGATAFETLEQARRQDPVSPRLLRPGVPVDLNVICLKCLEKDPARRYHTALEFAADLRRFLEGRPIVARAPSIVERVLKWTRRHPVVAVLSAVCLLCILGLVLGGVAYERGLREALHETNNERERAEKQFKEATRQANRADANYREASEAVRRMILRTKDPMWNSVPRLHNLRRQLIEDALAYYLKIASQQGEDLKVRQDIAWTTLEAGKIQIMLGRPREGIELLRQAVTRTEKLAKERMDDSSVQMLWADSVGSLGMQLQTDSAIPYQELSVSILQRLDHDHPGAAAMQVNALVNLGVKYHQRNWYYRALRVWIRGLEIAYRLVEESPKDLERLRLRARCRINLSAVYRQLQQQQRCLQQHGMAESDLTRLLSLDSNDRDTIDGLAVLRINGAYDLQAAGKPSDAIAYVQRNVPMLESALNREPNDFSFRDRMYRTWGVSAMMLRGIGKSREAAQAWDKVIQFADTVERRSKLIDGVEFWIEAKDPARAVATADLAVGELERSSDSSMWNRLADLLERTAKLAASDLNRSSKEREQLTRRCEDAAAAARKQALLKKSKMKN